MIVETKDQEPCISGGLKSKSLVFQGKVSEKVPQVIEGKGIWLKVQDPISGQINNVIYGVTGAAVGALGWGDPAVLDIINEVARVTTYSYPAVFGNKYAEKLADFIYPIHLLTLLLPYGPVQAQNPMRMN